MEKKSKYSLKIKIDNLTLGQAIAIEDMLSIWVILNKAGGSDWVAFYADGGGDFHPKISVNNKRPKTTELGGGSKSRWRKVCGLKGYFINYNLIDKDLLQQSEK